MSEEENKNEIKKSKSSDFKEKEEEERSGTKIVKRVFQILWGLTVDVLLPLADVITDIIFTFRLYMSKELDYFHISGIFYNALLYCAKTFMIRFQ